MLKNLAIAFLFILTTCYSFAQKIPLINSGDALNAGVDLYEKADYKGAIKEYKKICRSDTNYVLALYETALAEVADSQFSAGIKTCREALTYQSIYKNGLYSMLASALDYMGAYDSSISVFEAGLKIYPNDYNLLYNEGITYTNMKKIHQAVLCYEHAIRINPFHASSYQKLGYICRQFDQFVPGIMCYTMYLVLKPNLDFSQTILISMEKMTNCQPFDGVKDADTATIFGKGEDDFDEIQSLICTKLAIKADYKIPVKNNFGVVKQLYLMCDKLQENPSDKGFFNQQLVPTFNYILKNKYFPDFSYYILQSLKNKDVDAYIKSHEKTQKVFTTAMFTYFTNQSNKFPVVVNGKEYYNNHYYKNGNELMSIGSFADKDYKIPTGEWIYFYKDGTLKKQGTFDKNGMQEGEWKYYFENGMLKEVIHYSAGKTNGTEVGYFDNGVKNYEGTLKNSLIDGVVKYYYATGQISSEVTYENGMRNGPAKIYYETGVLKEEMIYKNDLLDGSDKIYAFNGQLNEASIFTGGKQNGESKIYYYNGKIKSEGAIKNNIQTGHYKHYSFAGKLTEEGDYNDQGKTIGVWKNYYSSGIPESESTYNNSGDMITYKEYDNDGKLWQVYHYVSGNLDELIFYNKEGKEISRSEKVHGKTNIIGYWPDGVTVKYKGQYLNAGKDGYWEYYYSNGGLSSTEEYTKGDATGHFQSFYLDGTLSEDYFMKSGDNDGYDISYFRNGKIQIEGWYVAGKKDGTWREYFPDGTISEEYFYCNGSRIGYETDYNRNGKPWYEYYSKYSFTQSISSFDTLGNVFYTSVLKDGNGTFIGKFYNDTIAWKSPYKNGQIDGALIHYHPNGKIADQTDYNMGAINGKEEVFDNHGKLTYSGNYLWNQKIGEHNYFIDGVADSREHYTNGNQDSVELYFYPDGKINISISYKDDERIGPTTYYDETGQVMGVLYYKDGVIASYSYENTIGKLVTPIVLKNATGNVTAYYKNGKKSMEIDYKKGFREGKSTYYFSSGAVKEIFTNIHGELEGNDKFYYLNGKLKSDENYFYNDYSGLCTYFFDTGKKEKELHYLNGKLNGSCTYYTKEGKLAKTEIYYCGELIRTI